MTLRRFVPLCLLALPATLPAQAAPDSAPRPRFFTLTAGFGTSLGGFGLQAEKYLARTRISLFGGIGYILDEEEGDYSGLGLAAGLRGFTTGVKHRGFLELSVSPLYLERHCFDACDVTYGPGLAAGWHFVTRGGFSLWLSAGIGVALDPPPGASSAVPIGGIGLGYTWRRH